MVGMDAPDTTTAIALFTDLVIHILVEQELQIIATCLLFHKLELPKLLHYMKVLMDTDPLFSHTNEKASPGFYEVMLGDDDIQVKLALAKELDFMNTNS